MTEPAHPPAAAALLDTPAVRVVNHDEWDALVGRLGGADTYFSLDYHRIAAELEPVAAHPVLLHHTGPGGELALPLLLRALPDGTGWDATSAYGYGGPVAPAAVDADTWGAAYAAWTSANDVVATFLRLHPLAGNASLVPRPSELVELGATVAWEVTPGRELLPAMHSHHRRAVRKADRAGVDVRIEVNPTDLAVFRAMYDHTMRRQEAASFYFFGEEYWRAHERGTDSSFDVVVVEAHCDGEPVASLLCYASGDALHYHLGASADAARSIGASNRCFLAAAEWAQSLGTRTFHLGGGVGAGTDSPLFQFKHRYDPESTPRAFHVAKLVHDDVRYAELAGTSSTAGYFPPWRAPA